ncbi:MAG: protoheme IX farnesyltransferase [Bdellovibrionales bacterium]
MRTYFKLTKSGIVWFVLLTAFLGYAMAVVTGNEWDSSALTLLLCGLYLVSSGSFSWNQAQEWQLDARMPRTQTRPIPRGTIQPWQAYLLGGLMIGFGSFLLSLVQPLSALLALATVVLYNGLYTLYWKKRWSFGAVPGAIPGAMPVVIGYSAMSGQILSPEVFYLFMIMFLWQMPHFWCLAIRYREDYANAKIPVLPLKLGVDRTLYHMGLYMFAYVGLAIAAPWFFNTHVFYLLLIVPIAIKVMIEFFRYHQARAEGRWLPFFLWVNVSMLAFLAAPVMDSWLSVWLTRMSYNL